MALRLFRDRPAEQVPDLPQEDQDTKKLNDLLDEMLRMSAAECEPWWDMAEDAARYTFGDQLHYFELDEGWRPAQVNYIFPAMQQQLAMLMQRDTRIFAKPWEDSDVAGAKVAESILRWYYSKSIDVKTLTCKCAMDGFLTGNWVLLAYWNDKPDGGWDEEEKRWRGRVEVTLVPYYYFGVAPGAESLADAEWVFIKRLLYVDEAKQRWPEYASKIDDAALLQESDSGIPNMLGDADGFVNRTGASALVTADSSGIGTKEYAKNKPSYYGRLARAVAGVHDTASEGYEPESESLQMVEVLEIWFKDRSEEHVKEEVPESDEELEAGGKAAWNDADELVLAETGEALTEANRPTRIAAEYDRPLYPNGRHILRIGRIILNSEPEKQRWHRKSLPFISGPYIWVPNTWRGSNAVELVREPQDMVNDVMMHIINAIKLSGDPWTVVEQGALPGGTDPEKIHQMVKNAAGKILVTEAGRINSVRREPPPPGAMQLFSMIDFLDELIRSILGIEKITQGKASGGRLTATELLKLDQNSRLRNILLSGDLERTTGRELMALVWEIVVENCTEGDLVRIVGEGNREEVIKIKGEYQDPETGVMMKGVLDAKFDLDIQVGSELPTDKQREKEEALQLFQAVGEAYLPRLLEVYGVPNMQEIIDANGLLKLIQQAQELDPAVMQAAMAEVQAIFQQAAEAQQAVEQGAMQNAAGGQQAPPQEQPAPAGAL